MTITVAGNKKEYEDGINLPTLIEKEQIDNADYVTVTINDEFVEREVSGDDHQRWGRGRVLIFHGRRI